MSDVYMCASAPTLRSTFLFLNKNHFLSSARLQIQKWGAIAHYKVFDCPRTLGVGALDHFDKKSGGKSSQEVIL